MQDFDIQELKKLYQPLPTSHKGQNGKLLIIGGSTLFHAASLWSLEIASRMVDMVYYSSVDENNQIVHEAKSSFKNGIVIARAHIDDYIKEADCVLIGPGLPRTEGQELGDDDTGVLSERLLTAYPEKKWVIDGGSLQTIDPAYIPPMAILTPHMGEFQQLFNYKLQITNYELPEKIAIVAAMAKKYNCVIVLKGVEDVVCSPSDSDGSPTECRSIRGGNAGMTKGGTGDVLAGLIAALYCKNAAFLAACAGSFLNKKAGEALYQRQDYYFNSSDLVAILPSVMKQFLA